MDTLEAIKKAQELGYAVNIWKDWSGAVLEGTQCIGSFINETGFQRLVNDLSRKAARVVNRAKFVKDVKARCLVTSTFVTKGDVVTVIQYDNTDDTVYIRKTTGATWWVNATELEVVPFVLKQDVEVDGDKGMIVKISEEEDDDEPYLVYFFDSDSTLWYSADEIEAA